MKYQLTEVGRDVTFEFLDLWGNGVLHKMADHQILKHQRKSFCEKIKIVEFNLDVYTVLYAITDLTTMEERVMFDENIIAEKLLEMGVRIVYKIDVPSLLVEFEKRGWICQCVEETASTES